MPTVNVPKLMRDGMMDEIVPATRRSYFVDVTNHGDEIYAPGLLEPAVITFRTRQPHSLGRCVDVTLPDGYTSKGFVTSIVAPIDGLYVETVKLSGAPTKRPGFLASALQATARELAREVRERTPIDTGALRGLSPDFMIVDDPLGPDPIGTPEGRQRVVDWYNKLHPNCRCVGTTTKEKPVKIRNKFYVAAPSVTTHSEQDQDNTEKTVHFARRPSDRSGKWTRKDLKDAIAHAQQVLEDDPTKDHVAVVKIIKVVRRPKPKFLVEDVK